MRLKNLFIIVVTLSIISLIGCSSDSISKGESSSGNNKEKPITLHFWGGVPAEAGPQEVVDNWNETHPDVQVEYHRFVNDDAGNRKLNTALQTEQNVDLFMSYAVNTLQERVNSNFVLDLGQFGDYDIEKKMGEVATEWKMNDTYYTVPTKNSASIILLNMDALDDAGLPIPTDWTWDEFREYAKKLTTENRLGYISFDPSSTINVTSALIDEGWVNEDGKSNFNHPQVKQGMEIMYEMMHTDKSMMPIGEQIATGVAADHMFINGEVAMLGAFEGMLRTTSNLQEYPRDFKIAFAPYPKFEGGSQIGNRLGDSISIAASSKYPEEAWEFVKWYADGGMLPQASGGRIPSSIDAPIDEAIELMVEGVEDTYDIESLTKMFSLSGKLDEPLPLQIQDALVSEVEKYFIGDQNIDDTINNIETRHNKFLE